MDYDSGSLHQFIKKHPLFKVIFPLIRLPQYGRINCYTDGAATAEYSKCRARVWKAFAPFYTQPRKKR